MRQALNPLDDLRKALKRTAPCTHHPAVAVSTSRQNASDWWEAFNLCETPRRIEHLRWMGQHDLWFLLYYLLNRKHLDTDFHFDRCAEIIKHPYNHFDLWGREMGKSDILSFGQNIRDVLNDPNITIGIFSHTRPMAKGFLRLIKTELEQNETLKDIYPDILYRDPERQSVKWAEDIGITVKRNTNRKEATIEAWGLIDGQPTGKRFQILHYDDVVSRKEITPDMIEKATREFENSLALTASDPPLYRYLATYQEIGDTTHQLVDRKFGPVRFYPAVDKEGHTVLFSEEKLAWLRSRTSPKMFALQYLLDPQKATADSSIGFEMRWIRREMMSGVDRNSLHIYIVVDPAGKGPHANSKYALWVMGCDAHRTWHMLDAVFDSLGLAERGDILVAMAKKWKPIKVGYETYSMQSDVEYMRERFGKEGINIPVVALGGMRDKDVRIEQLMPLFRDNKLPIPAEGIMYTNKQGETFDVIQVFLQQEYQLWPFAKQKDLLDALARICDADLGVVYPRAYRAAGNQQYNPWTHADGGGSWMSQ